MISTRGNGYSIKIGLIGKIRAGKDTVAENIKRGLSGETVELKFSSGIHDVIDRYIPNVRASGKPREALQDIGQLFRKFEPDVWVNDLLDSYDYNFAVHNNYNIIITDVRQENEAKRLKEEGFTLIKVSAPLELRVERATLAQDHFEIEQFHHETEEQADRCIFDYEIVNDGSLEVLQLRINKVVAEILLKELERTMYGDQAGGAGNDN